MPSSPIFRYFAPPPSLPQGCQKLGSRPQVSLKRGRVELTIHGRDLQRLHVHIQDDDTLDLEFIAADTTGIPTPADLVTRREDV